MKTCKLCNKAYAQNSFNFCLDDGMPLEQYDSTKYDNDAPTLVLELKTQVLTRAPKVIKRQFHDERGLWTRRIEYPQIEGLTSEYVQLRVNTLLRKKFFDLTETDEYDETAPRQTETSTIYHTKLITHSTLSVHLGLNSESEGAAHPVHYYDAFTFDLNSGYEYMYDDLFKPDSDYKNVIPALVTASLKRQADRSYYQFYPFDKRESFKFYLTKKSFVAINLYSAHVNQHREAPIRLTEIKHLIHPEGPLALL